MSPVDHMMSFSSKAMVDSVLFIGAHSGLAIAFVLLIVALIFSRSKAR
jgi:hypothetical protein